MKDQCTEEDEQEEKISFWVNFWGRLRHGKGTVAEPWPTVEEVLNNAKGHGEINVKKAYHPKP